MLYLSLIGLICLIIGAVLIEKSVKFTGLGIIIALVGTAAIVAIAGVTIKEAMSKSAKCASVNGSYGGGTCYVEGVEQDLDHLENIIKK